MENNRKAQLALAKYESRPPTVDFSDDLEAQLGILKFSKQFFYDKILQLFSIESLTESFKHTFELNDSNKLVWRSYIPHGKHFSQKFFTFELPNSPQSACNIK